MRSAAHDHPVDSWCFCGWVVGLDNSSCSSSCCSQAFVVAVIFAVAGYLLGIFMDLCHQEEMFQQLDGVNLKKGPWTSAEDAILVSYVSKHGEGNWNAVQKHSGLFRCGKSCRLRWANHLRPNLKKGAFSPDEERTILDLHSKFGNKWARMAAQVCTASTCLLFSCTLST